MPSKKRNKKYKPAFPAVEHNKPANSWLASRPKNSRQVKHNQTRRMGK
jgi:hypothetical protein